MEVNPKFPYSIERAHKYLMFLYINKILTDEEFDHAIERLNTMTGSNWCELAPIKDTTPRYGMGDVYYDWICPSCKTFLAFEPDVSGIPNRCPSCGQLFSITAI